MNKNYIPQAFYFTLAIAGTLGILSLFPGEKSLFGYTVKTLPVATHAREKMAYENKLLFWNLFEAMGGENSMAGFANLKPAPANKDYTYLNFAGGRKVGLLFAQSFIYEVEKYQKRRKSLAVIQN